MRWGKFGNHPSPTQFAGELRSINTYEVFLYEVSYGPMDLDRNRYFLIGVILFLLGVQFRMVDSFVLNESTTKLLHRFVTKTEIAETNVATNMYVEMGAPKKTIKPPKWFGFVLLTTGGVMALHALVLPRRN